MRFIALRTLRMPVAFIGCFCSSRMYAVSKSVDSVQSTSSRKPEMATAPVARRNLRMRAAGISMVRQPPKWITLPRHLPARISSRRSMCIFSSGRRMSPGRSSPRRECMASQRISNPVCRSWNHLRM